MITVKRFDKLFVPDVDRLLTLERTNNKVHNEEFSVYFDPQWDLFQQQSSSLRTLCEKVVKRF